MTQVLRWGRSAYETDKDLAQERAGAIALGLGWTLHAGADPPDLLERADVLVVHSGVRVDEQVVARLAGNLVITTTSGYDHIDLQACAAHEVAAVRVPEARAEAVVEHALGCLLGLMRRLPHLQDEARAGRWAREQLPSLHPRAISGSTVAVVGLGVIGRRMAAVLQSLGVAVLGVDPIGGPPGVRRCELEEALEAAHGVTLHCSLTESSRGLLSATRLRGLRPGAVVVNTARGAMLDVEAAVALVEEGHLGGLAVDVFPVEPYPRLAQAAAHPGVLLTPHGAGYTHDLGERVAEGVRGALTAWTMGRPLPHRVV